MTFELIYPAGDEQLAEMTMRAEQAEAMLAEISDAIGITHRARCKTLADDVRSLISAWAFAESAHEMKDSGQNFGNLSCGHHAFDLQNDCVNCLQTTVDFLNRELSNMRLNATLASSSTYGELVKRAPYLAQQIQSHEWDNKTPSEQRDWLLSTMDNKTLPEQPVSHTPATAEEIEQEIAFEKNLLLRCTNPVLRGGHSVCEHCGCDVEFAWLHTSNGKSECAAWIEGAKK